MKYQSKKNCASHHYYAPFKLMRSSLPADNSPPKKLQLKEQGVRSEHRLWSGNKK